ncbi:MAG: DNA-binding Lrp family transcriptional regulator [Paracrocinitomix sp.]|jgi:DNA-binding Lrp family transcriptional regulator
MQSQWSFVSNHSLVLAALHQNPDARQRDIADTVGITQGAVQRILHDLAESRHVSVERIGRRNRYRVDPQAPMRHPRLKGVEVGDLLDVLTGAPRTGHAA